MADSEPKLNLKPFNPSTMSAHARMHRIHEHYYPKGSGKKVVFGVAAICTVAYVIEHYITHSLQRPKRRPAADPTALPKPRIRFPSTVKSDVKVAKPDVKPK